MEQISNLFKDWLRSKNESLLVHLFQIIDHHESEKVRELALDHINRFLPSQKRELVLDLWINHPLPSLRPFIIQTIENYGDKIKKPLLAALYVMLDEIEKLSEIDPDLMLLDSYLETIDPSLGSLVYERAGKLKKRIFNRRKTSIFDAQDVSIADLLSRRDYQALWQSILTFPFPFIAELMKILDEEGWESNEDDIRYFNDLLMEYLGNDGWKSIENVLDLTLSIRDPSTQRFRKLTQTELRMKLIDIRLSPIVYTRPDRIPHMEFINRGRYNLVDSTLGFSIYQERVRQSTFTGKLHVPIYSSNGVQIAEVIAYASGTSSFHMDEDGLFFTIKTKAGTYSVDLDALATFILPFNQHTELMADAIDMMLSEAKGKKKLVLTGMKLLSELQQGRQFSVFDLKEEFSAISDPPESCCSLSINLGDAETELSIIPSTCTHKPIYRTIPTAIYYHTPTRKYIGSKIYSKTIGNEPIDEKLIFSGLKKGMLEGTTKTIRVQNLTIDVETAMKDFVTLAVEKILENVDYPITKVAFSHPFHSSIRYQKWFYQLFNQMGFKQVVSLEQSLAPIIADYRLRKTKGACLYIDLNEDETTFSLVELPSQTTRKRKEIELFKQNQPAPKIIVQKSTKHGLRSFKKKLEEILQEKERELDFALNVNKLLKDLLENFQTAIETQEGSAIQISLSPAEDDNTVFLDPEAVLELERFEIILKDIFHSGLKAGVPKSKIEEIIFTGSGACLPDLGRMIYQIFDKEKVLQIDRDPHSTVKGLGLFGNGQGIEKELGFEVMVRVTDDGLTNFQTLFQENERILGKGRKFQLNLDVPLKSITLDIWLRKPNYDYILDEQLPNQKISRIEDQFIFDNLTLFPKLIPIKHSKSPTLFAAFNPQGLFGVTIGNIDDEILWNDLEIIVPTQ
ncbi:MAG: hypothetical protein D6732_11600 [Methanobacteriota archaeon]|nr:MAG: hypothetical protein D6732_11600 [Euryarchaeota archaeon]